MNHSSRTPIRTKPHRNLTWAPKKEKHKSNTQTFCRRCSPKGKDCECSEASARNAQRCLNFLENEKAVNAEMNGEFTPCSSRTCFFGTSLKITNGDPVEAAKKIKECDLRPQINSKRKLMYAKALQN